MKRASRYALALLLHGVLLSLVLASFGDTGRWLTSAGLMLDMAGIVQLEVCGLFSLRLAHYEEAGRFPSHVAREMLDNPDRPWWTWLRNSLLFEPRTGFQFIVAGFLGQLIGAWV